MIARLAPACLVLAGAAAGAVPPHAAIRLPVPVIAQSPERCGPAALAMVLRFLGAPDTAVAEADRAYSKELRGALITDLARAALRAGYPARVAAVTEDSLFAMLADSVPPILYYRMGLGPITRGHYGVLVGWDPARHEYLLNDGGPGTVRCRRDDLMRRWKPADSLALIVRRRAP